MFCMMLQRAVPGSLQHPERHRDAEGIGIGVTLLVRGVVKMDRMRTITLIILSAILALCIAKTSAVAQVPQDAATPESSVAPRFGLVAVGDHPNGYFDDVVVSPGSSVTLAIRVLNIGEVPVELRLFKVNALNGVNGGYISGLEEDEFVGATEWIDFPSTSVNLEPGETQDLTFSISVPRGISSGQYLSGIVAESTETIDIPGSEVLDYRLSYAISVGVLVPGDLTHEVELREPHIDDEDGVRRLIVPVANNGNYLVRPAGNLVLENDQGESVLTSQVEMGSVYGGNTANLSINLPDQLASGAYVLDLTLTDPESGATDSIEGATVTVPEPVDPTGVSVANASIEPNADEIVFANVDLTLNNGGQQIPASDVTLEVLRDGEQVDEFPLATNQVLLNGENTYTTRYIPADMWEPGTYTFRIVVSAVDPNGGQETILLTEDLDAEIVVP